MKKIEKLIKDKVITKKMITDYAKSLGYINSDGIVNDYPVLPDSDIKKEPKQTLLQKIKNLFK